VIGRAAHSARLRAADAADAVRGRRDRLTPPRRLTGYVGDSDFRATGEEFLGYFRRLAGLQPGDRVLDVGCGIGRMARVLVPVLRPPGSYDGFDVVRAGIDWCRQHYRATPVPFRFQHADLRNASYNPAGAERALTYRFPYQDGSFDLVIATSVFTHLLADTAAHYLAETARVLAPGGRLFSTWYLLDGERPRRPPPPFTWHDATLPAAIADPAEPEAAVAFSEGWLRDRLGANGLALRALERGSWSGRSGSAHQDLVVASVA
jgi:SAM-dependent methyltransferase